MAHSRREIAHDGSPRPRARANVSVPSRQRILFLDFDGVLHPAGLLGRAEPQLPISSMISKLRLFRWTPQLESALSGHEVYIVVTSSWTIFHSDRDLQEFLGPAGHRLMRTMTDRPRWQGILKSVAKLRPSTWLVLDDDHSSFPLPLPSEVALCDPQKGITTPEVLERLRLWLKSVSK